MLGLCWNVLSNYVNAGARDLMYSAPGPGLTAYSVTGRAGWCINTSTHQDGAAQVGRWRWLQAVDQHAGRQVPEEAARAVVRRQFQEDASELERSGSTLG